MWLKIISIIMLAFGESLCIYSEMLIAKKSDWLWTFFLITLAGIPLLIGYYYDECCTNMVIKDRISVKE